MEKVAERQESRQLDGHVDLRTLLKDWLVILTGEVKPSMGAKIVARRLKDLVGRG